MSRDRIEGFLIGLGAGILAGAFMEHREERLRAAPAPDKRAAPAVGHERERAAEPSPAPQQAAHA